MEAKIVNDYQSVIEDAGWANVSTAVLVVSGQDRAHWLHKLVTADIEHLRTGDTAYGALLDAKGHFVADLLVLINKDDIFILTEPASSSELQSTLRRYIFRERVKVEETTSRFVLVTIVGGQSVSHLHKIIGDVAAPESSHFAQVDFEDETLHILRSTRSRVPSFDLLLPGEKLESIERILAALPQVGTDLLEILRVEAGRPRWGVDFDSTTLALEIPDVMQIRVDQGCYVGQEVVARIVHRGHVNRNLRGLRITGDSVPAAHASISCEGQPIGNTTSVVSSPQFGVIALGFVRREFGETGTWVDIGASQPVSAQVVDLPFAV